MNVLNPGESLETSIAIWMTELNNVYLDANKRIYTSMNIFLSKVFRLWEEYFFVQIQNNTMQYNIFGKNILITIILWSILAYITIRRQMSINWCNISCIKCLSIFCLVWFVLSKYNKHKQCFILIKGQYFILGQHRCLGKAYTVDSIFMRTKKESKVSLVWKYTLLYEYTGEHNNKAGGVIKVFHSNDGTERFRRPQLPPFVRVVLGC